MTKTLKQQVIESFHIREDSTWQEIVLMTARIDGAVIALETIGEHGMADGLRSARARATSMMCREICGEK